MNFVLKAGDEFEADSRREDASGIEAKDLITSYVPLSWVSSDLPGERWGDIYLQMASSIFSSGRCQTRLLGVD